MIFIDKTYMDFAAKIMALLDLKFRMSKLNIRITRGDRVDGNILITTELRTKEGGFYDYDFMVDMHKALVEMHSAADIAEKEAAVTIEEYTKALDTHE